MAGVFQLRANRSEIRDIFSSSNGVELVLFKPDFSEDESEDHDDSENPSESDGESTKTEDELAENEGNDSKDRKSVV